MIKINFRRNINKEIDVSNQKKIDKIERKIEILSDKVTKIETNISIINNDLNDIKGNIRILLERK